MVNHTILVDPNIVDFTNLSTLIGNIGGIFPGIIALVVNTIPLFVVQGILYLILGIFGAVIMMFSNMWR
jgi:hypothetical protein